MPDAHLATQEAGPGFSSNRRVSQTQIWSLPGAPPAASHEPAGSNNILSRMLYGFFLT